MILTPEAIIVTGDDLVNMSANVPPVVTPELSRLSTDIQGQTMLDHASVVTDSLRSLIKSTREGGMVTRFKLRHERQMFSGMLEAFESGTCPYDGIHELFLLTGAAIHPMNQDAYPIPRPYAHDVMRFYRNVGTDIQTQLQAEVVNPRIALLSDADIARELADKFDPALIVERGRRKYIQLSATYLTNSGVLGQLLSGPEPGIS